MHRNRILFQRILAVWIALTMVFALTYTAAFAEGETNAAAGAAQTQPQEPEEPSEPERPDRPDRPGGEKFGKPPKPEKPSAPDAQPQTDVTLTGETTTAPTMPPEIPTGEDGSVPAMPPEMPTGEDGSMPAMPPEPPTGEDGSEFSVPDDFNPDGMMLFASPDGGVESYDAAVEYNTDTTVDGLSIVSMGKDENAIHISDGNVTLRDVRVTRRSDESTGGDNASFYGVGASILATGGTTFIQNADVDSRSEGGAGIFAYGDGTVYAADSTIATARNTSGGLHVAGGGKLYAYGVEATTQGDSSAAIRSDRGGGTMVVDGGSFTAKGKGSPAVYSTADIAVHDAVLTATDSEAVCIEGGNSLSLYDCTLSGTMPRDERNDCDWTVIAYQSMSGDAEPGNGTFRMQGGTLTSGSGGLFYTTNTKSSFVLQNVDIQASNPDFFLRCTGNTNLRGWGTAGQNGAVCTFTAINQLMNGDVIWDDASQLDLYMTEGSVLTGAVLPLDPDADNGVKGYANVIVSADSRWIVTGNSTLSALQNSGTIVDSEEKTVTIVGRDGKTYVKGDSDLTVTVATYSDTANLTGAQAADAWSDHAVERPQAISADAAQKDAEPQTQDAGSRSSLAIVLSVIGAVLLMLVIAAFVVRAKKKDGDAAPADGQEAQADEAPQQDGDAQSDDLPETEEVQTEELSAREAEKTEELPQDEPKTEELPQEDPKTEELPQDGDAQAE